MVRWKMTFVIDKDYDEQSPIHIRLLAHDGNFILITHEHAPEFLHDFLSFSLSLSLSSSPSRRRQLSQRYMRNSHTEHKKNNEVFFQ